MEFADVSDVYVGLVGNAEEDNENTQNLGGQNLEGDNLGGVNENAQNVVEKNVYQNVTVVNVEDDNPTPTASEPTYPKSNKAHGNTTSTVWQHFTKKETKNKNEPIATCNYCWKPFKYPSKHDKLLSALNFDQAKCRRRLAEMIIVDEEPFKIVEHEGLRRWVSTLQPEFKVKTFYLLDEHDKNKKTDLKKNLMIVRRYLYEQT
ncbi:hypothetical protein ACLOJK_021917 [Asimina triloba]